MEHLIGFPGLGIEPLRIRTDAFHIGNFSVYWYAVIITCGLILAFLFALWKAEKFDLTKDNIYDILLFGLPTGVIGARIYYVIFKWKEFHSIAEMIDIRQGGLAIFGGIIAAFLTAYIYAKCKHISFFSIFDIGAIGFTIGQCIGRWGNFINAEAYGSKTTLPWGMTINGLGPYHPTFFYESLWNAIGFVLLLIFTYKLKKHHGEVFFCYLIWYGIGRAWIEGLRTDSLYIGTIRISQLVAIVCVFTGIVLMILSRKGTLLKAQQNKEQKKQAKYDEYKPLYRSLYTETTVKELTENKESQQLGSHEQNDDTKQENKNEDDN